MKDNKEQISWFERLKGGPYSRGRIGLPSALIAIGWIALWYAWPSGEAQVASRRRTETEVWHTSEIPWKNSRGLSPFIEPAKAMELADGSEDLALTLSSQPARPRFLEKAWEKKDAASVSPTPSVSVRTKATQTPFRPRWKDSRVFSVKKSGKLTLTTELSPGLTSRGFTVPGKAFSTVEAGNSPFSVVVSVDVDEQGHPEHVFVETSSGSKATDAAVVRAVYQGTVARAGARCSGRVTVNWGR